MSEGSGDQSQQRPWASPRQVIILIELKLKILLMIINFKKTSIFKFLQQPIKGIVQPRVLPPFGKPTRHTNKLDYIMTTVLKEAGKHKHVWPFQKPVDAVALCIPVRVIGFWACCIRLLYSKRTEFRLKISKKEPNTSKIRNFVNFSYRCNWNTVFRNYHSLFYILVYYIALIN